MSNTISDGKRKSRGKVKCHGCYSVIPKGVIYEWSTVVDQGAIWTFNKCPECAEYCAKCKDYDCEECYEGYIGEMRAGIR